MLDSDTRQNKRHNHIFLRMKVNLHDDWEPIKALDWNEKGFNFYLDRKLDDPLGDIMFRRAAVVFKGSIIWSCRNDDEDMIMETILNSMLFNQIKKHNDILKDSINRIINLLRSQGLIDEKIRMLSHLGIHGLSQDTVRLMVDSHKKEHPEYRFGIKADCEEWREIARNAFVESEPALMLDKIGQDLRL